MKIKTSELEDQALNWAVAKCEGRVIIQFLGGGILVNGRTELGAELDVEQGFNYMWHPSSSWAQAGPIIERECIGILAYGHCSVAPKNPEYWEAAMDATNESITHYGSTPLIAAMRCYVASKLDDEVEVPDELA